MILDTSKIPCKRDCENRNVTCHATCKKYIDWKLEQEVEKMKELEIKNKEKEQYEYRVKLSNALEKASSRHKKSGR